jgi:hypothetical protein
MELKPEHILVIGVLATVLAQIVKLLAARGGTKLGKTPISAGVFIVAVALAAWWMWPALPAVPASSGDPAAYALAILGFVGQLIAAASGVFGFATLIYNLLLQRVFEALGMGGETITALVRESKG